MERNWEKRGVPVFVINKSRLLLLAAIVIFSSLVDVFIFGAAFFGILGFLGVLPVTLYRLVFYKAAISERIYSALRWGGTLISIVLLSVGMGSFHDKLLMDYVRNLAGEVREYQIRHGEYPRFIDDNSSSMLYHGYRIHYINPVYENPYFIFDKFNYRRQSIDVKTGEFGEERDF